MYAQTSSNFWTPWVLSAQHKPFRSVLCKVETHRVPSADDPELMSSEIDYNVYLDFTLAIEYMQSPEALRYCLYLNGAVPGGYKSFRYYEVPLSTYIPLNARSIK